MLTKRKTQSSAEKKKIKEAYKKESKEASAPTETSAARPEDPPNQRQPIIWSHIFRRIFILALGFVAAYYSSSRKSDGIETFAQSTELISRRSFLVPCSQDYSKENDLWPSCIPRRCGRVIMDNLISRDDAEKMFQIAKKGFTISESSGGASILDLHSGALSKDDVFINLYSLPIAKGLFSNGDLNVYRRVKNAIQMRITTEFGAQANQVYLTHPTFFSKITNKPPQTIHDEYWHPHIDKKTYGTFHYTSLLYLNNYGDDFSGGRFIFVDKDLNRTVEPKLGRISLFTSGSENLHYVEKVTTGERYAITVSFTCNSTAAIPDPQFGL